MARGGPVQRGPLHTSIYHNITQHTLNTLHALNACVQACIQTIHHNRIQYQTLRYAHYITHYTTFHTYQYKCTLIQHILHMIYVYVCSAYIVSIRSNFKFQAVFPALIGRWCGCDCPGAERSARTGVALCLLGRTTGVDNFVFFHPATRASLQSQSPLLKSEGHDEA